MENNDVTLFSISYIDLVLVCHNVDVVIDKVRGLFAGISSSGAKAVSPSEAVGRFEAMDWYTEEYPPYNYVGEYGAPSAIAIDILIAAFKRINVNFPPAQVKITPWADSYVRILRNLGAALFSTTYTTERLQFVKIIGP